MAGLALSVPRSLDALFDSGVVGNLPDGQLIERFTARHREAAELAFHALVDRHGPMVLRVCRRVLDDPNDAEDAFQATFLILLRRAGSIRERGSVASWLHGVAHRVASRARVESARRRRIERQGIRPDAGHDDQAARLDLESLIDEELTRLPEKYQAPVVLCYLEGLTHEAAATRLGWPVGTVRGRLARARDLLRSRLVRRGIAAPSAVGAIGAFAAPARARVPAAMGEATVRAAADVLMGRALAASTSVRVATLVEATARGGTAIGAKVAVVTLVTVLGVAIAGRSPSPPPPPSAPQVPTQAPAAPREAVRRAMLQLKGTWTTEVDVQETVNGIPAPPRKQKMTWSIDRDTITESDGVFVGWTYRYSLNPDRKPATIDLRSLNIGLDLKGLYKLEGDTLTICYDHERPKNLEPRAPGSAIRQVLRRESRTPTKLSPRFPNAEGCYWAVSPHERGGLPTSMASGSLNIIVGAPDDGAMRVSVASMARLIDGEPDAEYRPVAFDADKKRYAFNLTEGGGWSTSASFRDVVLGHGEFRLDPAVLPAQRVKALGIEVVTPEGKRAARAAASKTAMQEARDSRIDVLPWPEVGKPYPFALKDTAGRAVRSADLKGKVVLIDCWAGWCSPCMTRMPGLKALYQRRHDAGLEVIGVNFDRHPAQTDELVKRLGLPWPEVYVPADDRTYTLWQDASGIHDLPRLLLIDRQGILRWDGGTDKLEKQVEAMLRM